MKPDGSFIYISVGKQTLTVIEKNKNRRCYSVSTARNGPGELLGSECTPLGLHFITEMFGQRCAEGTVFVGRKPTGEVSSAEMLKLFPDRDWIVTRIMWLSGLEPGRNLDGEVDTKARHIYIHGTPHEGLLGRPGSKGCIQMGNRDIIELFNIVSVGTKVMIEE
jgi:L,D-transpeptidase YbiS